MATIEKSDELKILIDAAKSASEGCRVFIEINGCRVAIVPPEDAEYMNELEDARDIQIAEERLKHADDPSRWTPLEEVMKEYGL